MSKIKRRRLKKKYRRLFLLIIIVLISILFIKCLFSGKNDSNNDSDNSNKDKINYNDFITNNIEEAVYLADRIIVLGGSPAHITNEYEIDIERPRNRCGDEFLKIRSTIEKYATGNADE